MNPIRPGDQGQVGVVIDDKKHPGLPAKLPEPPNFRQHFAFHFYFITVLDDPGAGPNRRLGHGNHIPAPGSLGVYNEIKAPDSLASKLQGRPNYGFVVRSDHGVSYSLRSSPERAFSTTSSKPGGGSTPSSLSRFFAQRPMLRLSL